MTGNNCIMPGAPVRVRKRSFVRARFHPLKTLGLFFAIQLGTAGVILAAPAPDPGSNVDTREIVDRYVTASRTAESTLRGMQMDVDIDASMPNLKKQGKLHALRQISKLGTVTYRALRFTGDNMIKKDVIAKFLTIENQPRDGSLAITPANYKFKYKGLATRDGRTVYILHITPKRKRVGLFKGELWIDASNYLPLRESGRWVKNPSIFLKRVEFIREYEIRDGIAVPHHIETVVNMRIVGKAELSVNFSNYSKPAADDEGEPAAAVTSSDSQ